MFSFLKSKKPTNVIAQEAKLRIPEHTPDLCLLQEYTHHLLFDPGNGFSRIPFISTAFSQERTNMWIERGTPPLLIHLPFPNRTILRARIEGSLFRIPSDDLKRLDTWMHNGVQFRRRRLKFLVLDDAGPEHPSHIRATLNVPYPMQDDPPVEVEAWAYVAMRPYWSPKIIWDNTFYEGREDSKFTLAPTFKQEHPEISTVYQYERERTQKQPAQEQPDYSYHGDIEQRRKNLIKLMAEHQLFNQVKKELTNK